jgi:predicted alpha/beta-hydrolase family hydrolase
MNADRNGSSAERIETGGVRGFLHRAARPSGDGLVLAHGAGSNCESPLLRSVAAAFSEAGFHVLRCDLPYRQLRPQGPPPPGSAERDRDGLREALDLIRPECARVAAGGHSYGGRQASMLLAEDPAVAGALLLLSYPLHPPRQRTQLRTAHFANLRTPAVFVHGTRDPFGLREEMETALRLIPAKTALHTIDGAGHDLAHGRFDVGAAVEELRGLLGGAA